METRVLRWWARHHKWVMKIFIFLWFAVFTWFGRKRLFHRFHLKLLVVWISLNHKQREMNSKENLVSTSNGSPQYHIRICFLFCYESFTVWQSKSVTITCIIENTFKFYLLSNGHMLYGSHLNFQDVWCLFFKIILLNVSVV